MRSPLFLPWTLPASRGRSVALHLAYSPRRRYPRVGQRHNLLHTKQRHVLARPPIVHARAKGFNPCAPLSLAVPDSKLVRLS